MANFECPICGSILSDGAELCEACGFKLQLNTASFEPVHVVPTAHVTQGEPAKCASIKIIQGPQRGLVFKMKHQKLTIGRNPTCDIFLNDMTVSRHHADMLPIEDGFAVNDAKSYNGTWVNNESVDSIVLKDGDIMQFGVFVLQYRYR